MRFLHYFQTLTCLVISSSLALSDQANDVIDHTSAISETLHKNQDAIDRYKGGIIGAVPVARVNYDTWSALRAANADLDNNIKFNDEESDMIVRNLTSINDEAINVYNAYGTKAPMLNQAGVGFMVPITLQALFREADDYMAALRKQVTPNHVAAMNQITADHTVVWKATFNAFEENRSSEPSQDYKKLFSAISPLLGLLA